MKFEIIFPLLCFSLDPLTNKHCEEWSSKLVDKFQDLPKVRNPAVSKAKI